MLWSTQDGEMAVIIGTMLVVAGVRVTPVGMSGVGREINGGDEVDIFAGGGGGGDAGGVGDECDEDEVDVFGGGGGGNAGGGDERGGGEADERELQSF
ncbi:hypothetical protein LOZ03_000530 [Ophidiomyces ophidiicola]|uniref:uncharacterized protein n=1 Tax=Ophidiomyces ophidiicola TaxID=1387563 RepID=UPI0020C29E48|nr:uncharacterized protein LOZ57_001963 [Ophidiomyces ophidiicola]KAI1950404.1 hypothetical protein LOZ57_001963 [Ophidiomyces ophidiicola]KAI2036730.1 hypothetical protein LOZ47_004090 [Ophidiomyces ophidiicola]KAI2063080.1 hypothetical protein LOZ43_000137 [Ophidiomyces ophidiicola]KAI2083078.1 hypothetical protein LOZ37_000336 [Ophidiomyces ophidiicola]KAI2085926.1 hypothetical protein LOZ36_003673 [Ophidiomyces ophidiicola]